jgi:hypothetical protein
MKHLLIIILSFLLLSSPVIGQETGVLYQYESSFGFVLKSFGDGKVQPKYKGEITNGKPNGFGVFTYPYGEKSVVGVWKNGKEWKTKHKNKDGKIIGKFEDGEWILKLGVLYFGFRNGKVGYYTEKWEGFESEDNRDFSKYEGEIKIGFPNGQGILTFPDGEKYVGEYKDGQKNGHGTYTWNDGGKYVGEYKNGQKNGHGTYTFLNGDNFEGEWKDGKQDEGTHTWSNKYKYEGSWKSGQMWNGIYYDNKGNLFGKQVNGEQQ